MNLRITRVDTSGNLSQDGNTKNKEQLFNLNYLTPGENFGIITPDGFKGIPEIKYVIGKDEVSRELFWRCLRSYSGFNTLKQSTNTGRDDTLWIWEEVSKALPHEFNEETFFAHEPLSFMEVMTEVKHDLAKAQLFGNMDLEELFSNLSSERIKADGIDITMPVWDDKGKIVGEKTNHNVYETYKADIHQLVEHIPNISNVDTIAYYVKCWCPSTEKAAYLWIDERYKDDPLSAIASCCRVQEDIKGDIIGMYRQGDIFYANYKPGFDMNRINPDAPKVPLTKEEYFNLLIAES